MTDVLGANQPQAPNVANMNPTMPTEAPQSGGLWRQVLVGALSGLAGSAGSKSFGGGLAAGAASSLDYQSQQRMQSRQDQLMQLKQQSALSEQQQRAVDIAHTQAETAQIYSAITHATDAQQRQAVIGRINQTDALRRAGILMPVGDVDTSPDHHNALNDVTLLTRSNPGKLYTAEPVFGPDGQVGFRAMQSTDAPLPEDMPLLDLKGKKIGIIPKGTPGTKASQLQIQAVSQGIQDLGIKSQVALENAQTNRLKEENGGAGGNGTFVEGTDTDGNQVAGTPDELKAAGVQHFVKMPALIQGQTLAARELTSPDGLFATARKQILDLQARGKLGPVASRWNNFWAGKGLDGDQQAFRGTLGLIATKLMQAHLGNRGGKDALEHFAGLVPEDSTPQALMTALNNEYGYVNSLSKRPKGGK